MKRLTASLLPLLLLGVQGCKKEPPPPTPPPPTMATTTTTQPAAVSVAAVTLGNAIGPDKKVTTGVDMFTPKETIYASVDTQGAAPSASLSARWTYQDGQVVHEETQTIAPSGPAATEFHISKPDGWPKGEYKVEILLDGASARTASFRVA